MHARHKVYFLEPLNVIRSVSMPSLSRPQLKSKFCSEKMMEKKRKLVYLLAFLNKSLFVIKCSETGRIIGVADKSPSGQKHIQKKAFKKALDTKSPGQESLKTKATLKRSLNPITVGSSITPLRWVIGKTTYPTYRLKFSGKWCHTWHAYSPWYDNLIYA